MVALVRFDADGRWSETWVCDQLVKQHLEPAGVRWGRWPLRPLDNGGLDELRSVYKQELNALADHFSLQSADRVTMAPGHPRWPELRGQFLTEHRHADAEIRFFLGGAGLFYIRDADGFLGLLCEAGDWAALPAGLAHSFDAGEEPQFDAIRLFGAANGWVAEATGAPVAELPLFDDFVGELLERMGEALEE
ncbi:hypothetical protein [Ottowia thiooxydans]|uniref:acireductone dioxygenase (Fe(2+)-requiring) n=1 Tax=Ottowia thiooxydans TaxID=219182 RepID=A0ABV2QF78_9BURK